MIDAVILWSHALAALLFGALAVEQWHRPAAGWPRRTLTVALALTALWALAVAGIDPRDLSTRLADVARSVAWLVAMLLAVRAARAGSWPLGAVYAAAIGLALLAAGLAVATALPFGPAALDAIGDARILCRMLGTITALLLLHHLARACPLTRPMAAALATIWSVELVSYCTGYVADGWPARLIAVRGIVAVATAMLLLAAWHRGERAFTVSRSIALRALGVAALTGYLAVTMLATDLAERWAGSNARAAQTAIVLGAATALITLLSTPWLRAWAKVTIAKHLFAHRYDYRVEWQRVTAVLGHVDGCAASLGCRAVQAIADLTDSPAGLLLVTEGDALEPAATWRWEDGEPAGASLARHLAATGRVVALDAVRDGTAPVEETVAVPAWMVERADAWAIVPLFHGAALLGAILLARPPVDRALDWEDFDLLRVAGRQAASCLAEDRARTALAEAERFDEFNRRFAFILHDLKNLVSGLTLVARNAERHADNPAFRADMVATLQDSAARMNALLARLSHHRHAADEPLAAVDLGALVGRMAASRRAQHPVKARGRGMALAQPHALEQLLGHLCQNAIEASAADQPVTLTVAVQGDRVAIEVVDRGCGMTPAFVRDRLFRAFASSKPSGFGIGAFEARQLAQAMGGAIEVSSREGEGTTFRVLLPAAPALEAAA